LKRGIIIKESVLNHQLDGTLTNTLTNTNIVLLAVSSIFLHYLLTTIILIILSIFIVTNKSTRKMIFVHKYSKSLILFYIFINVVSILSKNWFGPIVGLAIMLALILGLFFRTVMTKELYERVLTLICVFSLTSTSCAIAEKVVIPMFDNSYNTARISAMFFHPNYFGTIISIVIIICAYKVLTHQGKTWIYYSIGAFNIISIYLCESMFAWIEIFVGIAVLLIILKKHQLLAIWLIAAVVGGFTIFILNIDIIPRLSEAELTLKLRLKIWDYTLKQIKNSIIFGYGPMSFAFKTYKMGNLVPHSHSIYFDAIMNYGLIGTFLYLLYFARYYINVLKQCFLKKQTLITSLILAITAATLVHGLTDLTILWVQTLPLFLFILSGYGAYENKDELIPKVLNR
jgi:O-antigen ligase